MRLAHCDLAQAESRVVGAILVRLFGDHTYLDVQECLTGDHEVLTPSGWVPISTKPALLAAWNISDQSVAFEPAVAWYEGKATELLEFSSCTLSVVVTPNHKMACAKYPRPYTYEARTAASIFGLVDTAIPITGKWAKGDGDPDVARLFAAYQADGTLNNSGYVEFSFTKSRKIERLHALLQRMSIPYRTNTFPGYSGSTKPTTRFYIKGNDFPYRTTKHAGAYLLNEGYDFLRAYTEEHEFWDGSSENKTSFRLTAKSKEHLEWIATIAHLVGLSATAIGRDHHCYRMAIRPTEVATVGRGKSTKTRHIGHFAVYCPTVPSGFFMVRRNGLISVTGNCGDSHSLICATCWTELPWPEDFNLRTLLATSDRKFPQDLIKAAKRVAGAKAYRDKSYRDMAKVLTHGSSYDGKPNTMARHTHVAVPIIERFQEVFFSTFILRRWHRWVKATIETKRELTTMLGRRVYVTADPTASSTLREMIAYEPQSVGTGDYSAAGMQKVLSLNLPLHLVGFCHDALDFEYDRRDEGWLVPAVCEAMSWEIHLAPHPDRYEELRAKVRLTKQEERDLFALSELAGNPRSFRIPVDAQVGWNLAKRRKDGSNPNGLIDFNPAEPDSRRRIRPVPVSPLERLESVLLTKGTT